jgi:hypothetical protein
MGILLALGLAREFDLFVVSDTAPPLGLFFCRFEMPKAARKTVSMAMMPEFCFMMKPQIVAPPLVIAIAYIASQSCNPMIQR